MAAAGRERGSALALVQRGRGDGATAGARRCNARPWQVLQGQRAWRALTTKAGRVEKNSARGRARRQRCRHEHVVRRGEEKGGALGVVQGDTGAATMVLGLAEPVKTSKGRPQRQARQAIETRQETLMVLQGDATSWMVAFSGGGSN